MNDVTAIQTSEDLKLRVCDIRKKNIEYSETINVGDNFATCCDTKDHFVITGHRGFSGSGCEVKLWDLRKNQMVVCIKEHEMPVEAVKFYEDSFVSCGKDGKIVIYKNNGMVSQVWNHPQANPFNAMDLFQNGILAANAEPKVLFFTLNPLNIKF